MVESSHMMDVKVILVGDKHTGKSSFVTLYADTIGQERDLEVITHYLPFDNGRVKLKVSVWDSPKEQLPNYYHQAFGALVVFDLTDHATFVSAAKYINEVKDKASSKCQLILIGNKVDRCLSKFV